MAERQNNHTCILCGAGYYACDDCSKIKSYTAWRTVCCSQRHYLIYLVLKSYQKGLTDAEGAQAELADFGILPGQPSYGFVPGAEKLINEIFIKAKEKN